MVKNRILKTTACLMMVLSAALFSFGCGGKQSPEKLRDLGAEAYAQERYEDALIIFEEAMEAGRGKAGATQIDILRFKADCEARTGRYEKAAEDYRILIAVDDSEENRALYEGAAGQIEYLKLFNEGNRLLEQGEYQKAKGYFEQVADLEAGSIGRIAWYNRAVCAEHLQEYAEALRLIREYVEKYPDDEKALHEYDFLKYEGNTSEPYR